MHYFKEKIDERIGNVSNDICKVEDWEWENWRKAERHMSLADYAQKQKEAMTGIQTREAFVLFKNRQPKEGKEGEDELGMFFMEHEGSKSFKQRYFQYRSDVPEELIAGFYQELEKNQRG
jgi:hypothetical protein